MTRVLRRRRALRRAAVLLLMVFGTVLAGATPASAHPTLLFTDPATDTAVPDTPPVITLVFNEPVTAGPRALTLLDSDGRMVPLGPTSTAREGHVVSAAPAGTVRPGTYRVRWQVTGSDGDQVEEEFRFAVGTAVTGAGTTGAQSIAWGEAALRWLLFAGLALALGGVIGERFTTSARRENPRLPAPRSWVPPAALVGLAGVVALAVLLIVGTGTPTTLWQGRAGQLLAVEALGLAVAFGLSIVHSGRWRPWAVIPLLAVVDAEGWRSHANIAAPGWGGLLTGTHLAAVAIWVGALTHVARAVLAWRRERPAVRWVLAGYLRLAGWVFALVVTTGIVSALLLVPLSALLTTTYGQVLLIKLALVIVAAGLALTARLAVRRDRADRVRLLARLESTALVGVLALSAVLVSTPPATSQQPGPPPPRGQVVPLGTLAGQVGVTAQASDGQLVVRLTTPRRGDYYAPEAAQSFTLSGQLTSPHHESTPLEFSGCGNGCFMSTVDWSPGDNVLSLHAQASTWRGGNVSLLVPWPVTSGAAELARAVQALRTVDHLTVYEAVTSDTTTALPEPQQLELTGEFFAAQEPYAAGSAPIATRISRDGQPVRLALGYPAAATTVALTLDAQGRISEETLTDDTHLIHRRFVYPGHE
ncbi:copper resistance CopC/CopD family protein [Amycolatopsis saalfeldensis]|uniref:Copper transport protein n=1 Tax=Amycolatopsis saalfeldensis TaxID=394193 RepID=A0A1H8YMW2_9PSEU|nr:copper resistance protein CopC [Amycolatopsis saalfeldensis]SEP53331.1 copper transport protein [Amycolatopsis saalfeldensis]